MPCSIAVNSLPTYYVTRCQIFKPQPLRYCSPSHFVAYAPAQARTTNSNQQQAWRPWQQPFTAAFAATAPLTKSLSHLSISSLDNGSLMAEQNSQKHQRAEGPSPTDTTGSQSKKRRTSYVRVDVWAPWRYAPEFWDRLSMIHMTRKAMVELNRRNSIRHDSPALPPTAPVVLAQPPVRAAAAIDRGLVRSARHGGLDLSDLRGYPYPVIVRPSPETSSGSRSSRSQSIKSGDRASTSPISVTTTTTTEKSTPYNLDFDLHLTDHRVHTVYSSQAPDLGEIIAAVAVPRSSLSPSKFSDGAFEDFQENNELAQQEDDVMADVIPTIIGPHQNTEASARSEVFRNLEHLTDGTLSRANPDLCYGAFPEELDRSIRDELADHILPSTRSDEPMAPNFFLDVKGTDGCAAVATRQARYYGAIGARGMHSLQNHGIEEPRYDLQAYTYSSTYMNGMLRLFAHYLSAPLTHGGRPEYHMTQVDAWDMTNDIESFRRGATAFRNARDLAKQHRDNFIKAANIRAGVAVEEDEDDMQEIYEIDARAFHEFGDFADYLAMQSAAEGLWQNIDDDWTDVFHDSPEAVVASHYLYVGEDAQEPIQVPTTPEFAALSVSSPTSFTSSRSSSPSRSKLPQSPSQSPSSKASRSSKDQTRPADQGTVEMAPFDVISMQSGDRVTEYFKKGQSYFTWSAFFESLQQDIPRHEHAMDAANSPPAEPHTTRSSPRHLYPAFIVVSITLTFPDGAFFVTARIGITVVMACRLCSRQCRICHARFADIMTMHWTRLENTMRRSDTLKTEHVSTLSPTDSAAQMGKALATSDADCVVKMEHGTVIAAGTAQDLVVAGHLTKSTTSSEIAELPIMRNSLR
ncbi:hypothetical protein B0J13DRAFT_603608 [Dactylonectria estremocensis]|uniref:DUF7924 domain-containing protein n=1 Tax=Dactylonectria estremocensis TaxID=1079267 RepID=A0A9P9FC93_9HYPO|nr:hypothetical protein B0J13DRAFT_603608 [Dactylonectria estremocensis]